jgi:hypothetical protein
MKALSQCRSASLLVRANVHELGNHCWALLNTDAL